MRGSSPLRRRSIALASCRRSSSGWRAWRSWWRRRCAIRRRRISTSGWSLDGEPDLRQVDEVPVHRDERVEQRALLGARFEVTEGVERQPLLDALGAGAPTEGELLRRRRPGQEIVGGGLVDLQLD